MEWSAAPTRAADDSPPVLEEATCDGGGVQGLGWFSDSLLQDGDGDTAHAFFRIRPVQQPSQRRVRSRL